jgi:hypothetical protein
MFAVFEPNAEMPVVLLFPDYCCANTENCISVIAEIVSSFLNFFMLLVLFNYIYNKYFKKKF